MVTFGQSVISYLSYNGFPTDRFGDREWLAGLLGSALRMLKGCQEGRTRQRERGICNVISTQVSADLQELWSSNSPSELYQSEGRRRIFVSMHQLITGPDFGDSLWPRSIPRLW